MRSGKKSAMRRAHIFSTAKRLFETQGFEQTSVDQIVQEAGIAKGTFYYYFKSKEDALSAIMEELDANSGDVLRPILEQDLPADEKLNQALSAMRQYYAEHMQTLGAVQSVRDEQVHFITLVHSIQALVPPFTEIIEQGVAEGIFSCEYPRAMAECILSPAHFLLDSNLFPCDRELYIMRLQTIQVLLEKGLSVPAGSLPFISEWRGSYYQKAASEEAVDA